MMVSWAGGAQSLQERTGVHGPPLFPINTTPLLNFSPKFSSFSAPPSPLFSPLSIIFFSLSTLEMVLSLSFFIYYVYFFCEGVFGLLLFSYSGYGVYWFFFTASSPAALLISMAKEDRENLLDYPSCIYSRHPPNR